MDLKPPKDCIWPGILLSTLYDIHNLNLLEGALLTHADSVLDSGPSADISAWRIDKFMANRPEGKALGRHGAAGALWL